MIQARVKQERQIQVKEIVYPEVQNRCVENFFNNMSSQTRRIK